MQRFVAHELRLGEGGAYSLEREPHVVEDKEPDVRLQARSSTARLPIEVKDTDSGWTLDELERGLTRQLCRQYLRDPADRHGIYLIVHRFPRRWRVRGKMLEFTDVLVQLRSIARRIATETPSAPQVEVCAIDVSDMSSQQTRRMAGSPHPPQKATRKGETAKRRMGPSGRQR